MICLSEDRRRILPWLDVRWWNDLAAEIVLTKSPSHFKITFTLSYIIFISVLHFVHWLTQASPPPYFQSPPARKKNKKNTASAQVVDCLTGRNGSCPLKRPLPSEVTSPWGSRELLQTASHTVWPFIESNQGGQASILWGTEQEKSCVVPTCLICEWAPSHLMFHCMISYKSKKLFGIMLPLYSTNS